MDIIGTFWPKGYEKVVKEIWDQSEQKKKEALRHVEFTERVMSTEERRQRLFLIPGGKNAK